MGEARTGAPGGVPEGPTEYRPPAIPWIHRLRFRLAALVFLAVLPLVVLLAVENLRARDEAIRAAGREAGRLARIAARNQQEGLAQGQALVEELARAPEVREGAAASRSFLIAACDRNPGLSILFLIHADGSAVFGGKSVVGASGGDRQVRYDPETVDRARKSGKTAVGGFFPSAGSGATVHIAVPVGPSPGSAATVLDAVVTLGWLAQFQRALEIGGDSTLQVLDPEGMVLLALPKEAAAGTGSVHPMMEIAREILPGEDRPIVAADAAGTRRFFGRAPLVTGGTRQGFMVVIGIPEEGVVGPLDRSLRLDLIVALVALVVALGVAHYLGRRLVLRRVQGLILATRRLASTDLSKLKARTRVCQDPSELGDLERSFDEMAKALETRARELDARAREMGGGKG